MDLQGLIQARKIINEQSQNKVSARLAYKMMKFMKASDDEDAFYVSQMREIIEKYALRDENNKFVEENGNIVIQSDKIQECQETINNLGKTEIELQQIYFSIEELEELKLTARDMYALDDFIK